MIESDFQASMAGRFNEIKIAWIAIENRAFTRVGSEGFRALYTRMLECQILFEFAALEFPYSAENYIGRAMACGAETEIMYSHYLFQRKLEADAARIAQP